MVRCLTIGSAPTAREPLRFTVVAAAAAAVFEVADDLSDMSEVEFEAAGCRMEVRRAVASEGGGIIICCMNLVLPAVFRFLVERGGSTCDISKELRGRLCVLIVSEALAVAPNFFSFTVCYYYITTGSKTNLSLSILLLIDCLIDFKLFYRCTSYCVWESPHFCFFMLV